MKFHSFFSSAAITAGILLSLAAAPVQAETTYVPNYILKSQGIDMRTTEVVNISPDNTLLCCFQGMQPKRGQKALNTMYIIPITADHKLGRARSFPLEGIGTVGNVAFTPDSKAVIFTTLEGSKIVKLDCKSGDMTTIMEHVEGKPGFKIYPPVLEQSDGKLLALGYHYNGEDFAGPNAIVQIDDSKTGLDAFVDARLLDHVQDAVKKNSKFQNYREGYPMLDVGYITGFDENDTYCVMYAWDGERGSIKKFEDCKGYVDSVFSASRTVYSVQDKDGTYRLCVYDAKTGEKFVVDSGRAAPHYYTLMSSDGKTIVFSDEIPGTERYQTFYARESEGWKIQPIEGLERIFTFGRQRVSCDGSLMVFHDKEGLRIVELKPAENK